MDRACQSRLVLEDLGCHRIRVHLWSNSLRFRAFASLRLCVKKFSRISRLEFLFGSPAGARKAALRGGLRERWPGPLSK